MVKILKSYQLIVLLLILTLLFTLFILISSNINTKESFIVLYDNINDYLAKNIDNNILRDSYCFDNDNLLSKIKEDPNLTCASHYENVSDIHYKVDDNPKRISPQLSSQAINNSFYDIKTNKSYSFAELCPITSNQINSTVCLRKHNNDISDTMFRLDNILTDTELKLKNDLSNIDNKITEHRNDKYRLFNSTEIQDYYLNNKL
jgi:hypothetical protein